jgi:2-aminoadipate transaminase
MATPNRSHEQPLPLAESVRIFARSPLQEALDRAADPAILSLSLGIPDPELFPIEALTEASLRVLRSNPLACQYAPPSPKLKATICELMARRGVDCSPDQVVLTVGAQQGVSLLLRLLLAPGGIIMEERLSYTGFQHATCPYEPRVLTVPSDSSSGIDLDALERMLVGGVRPAFLYVMADGHNPLGSTMPLENRVRLTYLAREFHMPIIEDDPYGLLEYERTPIAAIRSQESRWVYYVGSFSKLLAPALRVGWLVVPFEVIEVVNALKEASDINTSNFAQLIVAEFLEMGAMESHVERLIREYGIRRNAMNAALIAGFPGCCSWKVPRSGVFFWVELPCDLNASDLLKTTVEREHVAFLPAQVFSRGLQSNGIRLNFSRWKADIIDQAVQRIGNAIKSR